GREPGRLPAPAEVPRGEQPGKVSPPESVLPEAAPPLSVQGAITPPQGINLIRVPGPQKILVKGRGAGLNRTGLRQIGADFLVVDPDTGTIAGTQIGGAALSAVGAVADRTSRGGTVSNQTTVFGIFEPSEFQVFLSALRRNSMLKLLAEPNLVALNGHQASFLAGGEFPVPVPQTGGGGIAPTITVQFKEFGVQLDFVPYVLDGDVIRLTVDPVVSSLDFAIGTVLVPGGSPVPGLNTRQAHT